MTTTVVRLNGRDLQLSTEPEMPLLWLVRGELGLTGTKYGCGMALCGACTVLLDGQPVRGCVTPLSAAAGREVTTIEGLEGREADAVRAAWLAQDVVQCGWCQSGQIMAATVLLRQTPAPTDAQIDAALSAHLCRCGTYPRIRAAVHEAAAASESGGALAT